MLLVILLGPFHFANATFRTCGSRPNRPKLKIPHLRDLLMGRITGLEPATFGTTNQRSNQLSYIRHTELRGGADRTRTDDPLHAMQVLYQLSYNPKTFVRMGFLHPCGHIFYISSCQMSNIFANLFTYS